MAPKTAHSIPKHCVHKVTNVIGITIKLRAFLPKNLRPACSVYLTLIRAMSSSSHTFTYVTPQAFMRHMFQYIIIRGVGKTHMLYVQLMDTIHNFTIVMVTHCRLFIYGICLVRSCCTTCVECNRC